MSGSLLFVSTLFNVELVPPPVLADSTGSRVCHCAMLAAPSLRGWIRCVCYGKRWLGVDSNEADWALELSCQLSQKQFDASLFSRSTSPCKSHRDSLFSTPAPFHTFGTLKFSKYCRLPQLMEKRLFDFHCCLRETEGRAEKSVLSLAMNNDSLRISIIIMITISICTHFAVTVLHMHKDSVWGNSIQDLNTPEGLRKPRRGSDWSGGTECKIAEKLASAETHRIWLISQKTPWNKGLDRPQHTLFSM